MNEQVHGLHHITAIAGDAQRNYDFYTKTLGLRMVKRTVNFDDPHTYHFYFADETGTPGTVLTFFPWPRARKGQNGAGMVTGIGYSVPPGSLSFWKQRFEMTGTVHGPTGEWFGEKAMPFRDPDGLHLILIEADSPDNRRGWITPETDAAVAIKGFHTAVITLRRIKETAEILTDVFGYRLVGQNNNLHRYRNDAAENAAFIDLVEDADAPEGVAAAGTNHHIAFRVPDEQVQMALREKILSRGLYITDKINRDYFFSLYFREPGGVLFEIATDKPGFTIDEPVEQLGSSLKLPGRYESMRSEIEKGLPELHINK